MRALGPLAILVLALSACDRQPTSPPPASRALLAAVQSGEMLMTPDASGQIATISTAGFIDQSSPFFQSLGTNGRSCGSCHIQGSAWGLSAAYARNTFDATGGSDPLFSPVDGANCPSVTPADGAAGHSLLLNNGLIRVALTVPGSAEFAIAAVHDPYGCALQGSPATVSVYRRPLPATNLRFLSAVMFDGRETVSPLTSAATFLANLKTDLAHQALDATLGHAQAAVPPTAAQLGAIVDFELSLFTAQRVDTAAGVLNAQGAAGGPDTLLDAPYYPGINDPLGGNPTGAAFDPVAFTVFSQWLSLKSSGPYAAARAAVARGEVVFDTHPLTITNVAGLNDALGVPAINGTCTTCHDTPNVGNHSRPVPLDIGTSHAAAYESAPEITAALAQLSTPDLPVYQVTCPGGVVRYTTDPGRALITGRCSDVGRIKGPILRGLAARAPYFHNGSAATLHQVVEFYNQRFQIGLTAQEKSDLEAFLSSL